jgi:hypothetical protein
MGCSVVRNGIIEVSAVASVEVIAWFGGDSRCGGCRWSPDSRTLMVDGGRLGIHLLRLEGLAELGDLPGPT